MNGRTQRDHIAPYSGIDADRPSHAVKRIPPVIRLLVMEIDDGTKDPRFEKDRDDLLTLALDMANGVGNILRSGIERDGITPNHPQYLEWVRSLTDARMGFLRLIDEFVERIEAA